MTPPDVDFSTLAVGPTRSWIIENKVIYLRGDLSKSLAWPPVCVGLVLARWIGLDDMFRCPHSSPMVRSGQVLGGLYQWELELVR